MHIIILRTPSLAGSLCEDSKPLIRFCGKLYRWIDCIFFRYYSQFYFQNILLKSKFLKYDFLHKKFFFSKAHIQFSTHFWRFTRFCLGSVWFLSSCQRLVLQLWSITNFLLPKCFGLFQFILRLSPLSLSFKWSPIPERPKLLPVTTYFSSGFTGELRLRRNRKFPVLLLEDRNFTNNLYSRSVL